MSCTATHPLFGYGCERKPGPHEFHTVYDGSTMGFIEWPNPDYVKPARRVSREQQTARTRKQLKDMAERATEVTKVRPKFFPSENDRLGRTALYMRKYKGKWIALDELELKTVAGAGAKLCITTLINRYGWEIKSKTQAKDERQFFMLVSE